MLENYKKLNNSFKKSLVYNLGSEAGFFSEFNNMVLAILYCLKNEIKFILFSKNESFLFENGWLDFFEPFCCETHNLKHRTYNIRQPIVNSQLKYKLKRFYFKKKNKYSYLTSDLWHAFHSKEFEKCFFNIPELGIYGDTQEASRIIISIIWRYNKSTLYSVQKYIYKVNLPQKYAGFHIRAGDKTLEIDHQPLEKYMKKLQEISSCKNIFVLTDDYLIFLELSYKYPDYKFYTLCGKNENGYSLSNFQAEGVLGRKDKYLNLFASIEILNNGLEFVGTFSSNPGMYLGMRMSKKQVHAIDFDKWIIW